MSQKFIIITLMITLALSACSSDDLSIEGTEDDLQLEYTDPPFQLTTSAIFSRDIEYGETEDNRFDVFLPESETPTGMVIYIHGGAFLFGDKSTAYSDKQSIINSLLSNNQAFASINYHLFDQNGEDEGVIRSLNDVKRCLQFIRHYAETFNIAKENIVLTGNSAGAGAALWVAFNPEMAEPEEEDVILREQTRVKAAAVVQTQATYDLQHWEDDIFSPYNFSIEQITDSSDGLKALFLAFYGMESLEQFNTDEIQQYRQRVDMLNLLTGDDPEFFVDNTTVAALPPTTLDLIFHHPYHAKALRERADSINADAVFYYGQGSSAYADPSGESELDFLLRKLSE